jgi:ribonuclease BN (tRNA processing enzyme)
MKLTVLGCNGPYPEPGGACSGYLLQDENTNILLDCGSGVLAQLEKILPPERLTAVILSHLHYDHMSDMLPMIYRCPGLKVYLPGEPSQVRQLLEGAFDLQDISRGGRIGTLCMQSCPGRHPVPSYAVRIENAAGKGFVYTGDTNTCAALADFAKDCDFLLADGCFSVSQWQENKPHLSACLAGELAAQARAKALMVTHFTPGYDANLLLQEAKKAYPAACFAKMGLTVEV